MSEECHFTSRRISCTRAQMEELSELKRTNGGSIAKTVQVFSDCNPMPESWDMMDLIRFAEDCDKILADWEKPTGHTFQEVQGA